MIRLFFFALFAVSLAACQSGPAPSASTAAPTRAAAVATNTAPPPATATLPPTVVPTNTPPTAAPTVVETPTPAPTEVAPTATPSPSPATREVYVNADDGLNLRSDPSATATLLRTLANGTRLTAIGAANPPDARGVAWQNVRTDDGQSGWVAAQFLIDSKPVAAAPTAAPTAAPPSGATPVVTPIAASGYVYVAAPDGLNLRADKSSSSQLLATLSNGQRLKTNGLGFGPDNFGITWLNVETEAGVQGWVAKQFISDQVPSVAPAGAFTNETDIAAEILRRTNEFRQQNTLPPLVLNNDLSQLALAHSAYMSQAGNTHHSADGLSAKQRIANAGYGAAWPVENIYFSYGPGALDDAWGYWTTDLDHRNNLLTERNTVIGIGVYKSGQMVYMTQDFGKPAQ